LFIEKKEDCTVCPVDERQKKFPFAHPTKTFALSSLLVMLGEENIGLFRSTCHRILSCFSSVLAHINVPCKLPTYTYLEQAGQNPKKRKEKKRKEKKRKEKKRNFPKDPKQGEEKMAPFVSSFQTKRFRVKSKQYK